MSAAPRRLPLSGSPQIDNMFQSIWMALATINLWAFLYGVTLATSRFANPMITTMIFAGLLIMFLVVLREL